MGTNPSPELEFTAFHEAGHAVASVRFGFTPMHVTIVPIEDSLGHSRNDDIPEDSNGSEVANYIILLLAGYVANLRTTPDRGVSAREGAEADFSKAGEYLLRLGERVDEACWDKWLARTTEWVSEATNWRAIEEVAAELLDYSTLNYDEVQAIVEIADDPSDMNALDYLVQYRAYSVDPPRIRVPSSPGETVEGRNYVLTADEERGFLLRKK